MHNYRNEAHYDILPLMPNALCHMLGVGGHSGTMTVEWQAGNASLYIAGSGGISAADRRQTGKHKNYYFS